MDENIKTYIKNGKAILGIELGSTRIKAILIDDNNMPIASGEFNWQNQLIDGIWTYDLKYVEKALSNCYMDLKRNVLKKYKVTITNLKALGISGMMHGYIVLDKNNKPIAPFKTWRNNISKEASIKLSNLFNYPIPQRWSIAHYYQCMLNNEKYVKDVCFLTTLSGYVHYLLTGEKVLGIGDASGIFPIDLKTKDYNKVMIKQFNELSRKHKINNDIYKIMPKVLIAGENAGILTKEGVKLLDKESDLCSGIPMAAPEGDAGTGMIATNTIKEKTGNVSAGTSIFAMVVLEKELSKIYEQIDLVTTPTGKLVAMAHSNNCTTNLDSWINLFMEVIELTGNKVSKTKLYELLYTKALSCKEIEDGIMSYGYISGEHMTGFSEGRPLLVRKPDALFNIANFMRANLFTTLGSIKIGLDILLKEENVKIEKLYAHGGLFKTKLVGQMFMSAAINSYVSVGEIAGEGGAWGIALLASYLVNKSKREKLENFLDNKVFVLNNKETVIKAPKELVESFEKFMIVYKNCLEIERSAVNCLK
ncbi:xylulokinase [Oceanivirga salmonicida]|uniref:xylulokinase n=1 Tax=Oceanivirga salmonicida TaxID=1769291 RepID=UPI0018D22ED2|nr:FGGY-family carbohydrate kinase [Oceanivirga salmonicida]